MNKSPILVGFLAKKTAKRFDGLDNRKIVEICSVSECISPAPEERIALWTHNDFSLYNTESLALETVPQNEMGEYEVFAYRLLPLAFDDRGVHDFDPRPHLLPQNAGAEFKSLPSERDVRDFETLGYDLVSRSGSYFDCSPLSCNYMANEHEVNEFCLMDDLEAAIQLWRLFGSE